MDIEQKYNKRMTMQDFPLLDIPSRGIPTYHLRQPKMWLIIQKLKRLPLSQRLELLQRFQRNKRQLREVLQKIPIEMTFGQKVPKSTQMEEEESINTPIYNKYSFVKTELYSEGRGGIYEVMGGDDH